MSNIIGYVSEVNGGFKAISTDGQERILAIGDPIYTNDKVIGDGSSDSKIAIESQDKMIELAGNEPMLFDASLVAGGFNGEELELSSIYDIESMVNDTSNSVASIYDIEEIMSDTAAGREDVQKSEVTQNQFDVRNAQEGDTQSSVTDESFAQTTATEINSQTNIYNQTANLTQEKSSTTLRFDADDKGIDFSTIESSKLSNIEIIDLNSNSEGNNTEHELTNLSLEDVLTLTNSSNELKILGDEADKVELLDTDSDQWSKNSQTVEDSGHTFDVFTNSGDSSLEVKVEVGIVDSIV